MTDDDDHLHWRPTILPVFEMEIIEILLIEDDICGLCFVCGGELDLKRKCNLVHFSSAGLD